MNTKFFVLFLTLSTFSASCQQNNYHKDGKGKAMDSSSVYQLDERTFTAPKGLTFKIYLLSNNKYYLKISNGDSVQISPFVWEDLDTIPCIFDKNATETRSVLWNDSLILIAAPAYQTGCHVYKVFVSADGLFSLSKGESMVSEMNMVIDNDKKRIYTPIQHRGEMNGRIEVWTIRSNRSKWVLLDTKEIYDKTSGEVIYADLYSKETAQQVLDFFSK